MKLDLTVIKNESAHKFEKALHNLGMKFQEMLSLALDTAIHEIDKDKREQVQCSLDELLHDEFGVYKTSYIRLMNKAGELVETGLGTG